MLYWSAVIPSYSYREMGNFFNRSQGNEDKEKRHKNNRYSHYDYVERPDFKLLCKNCFSPCTDVQKSLCCGALYCRDAILEGLAENRGTCKVCKQPFQSSPDLDLDNQIQRLEVYCRRKSNGCKWTGKIIELEGHLEECKIPCERCGQIVYYDDMQTHRKTGCPIHCYYCGITGDLTEIKMFHGEYCEHFVPPCPNNCGSDVPEEEIHEHIMEACPLRIVQCEYYALGCKTQIASKYIRLHNRRKNKYHSQLLRQEIYKASQEVVKYRNYVIALCIGFLILAFAFLLLHTHAAGTDIRLYQIMNYLHTETKSDPVLWSDHEIPNKSGQLGLKFNNDQVLVAPVIFKMSNVSKMMETKETWNSNSFFAFYKGYKMYVRVDSKYIRNFYSEDNYLSISLHLMKGPYDDELQQSGHWPLRGTFTLKLLNQNDDLQSHTMDMIIYNNVFQTDTLASKGCHEQKFIPRFLLSDSNSGYLKYDILYFQISYMDTGYHYFVLRNLLLLSITSTFLFLFAIWLSLLKFYINKGLYQDLSISIEKINSIKHLVFAYTIMTLIISGFIYIAVGFYYIIHIDYETLIQILFYITMDLIGIIVKFNRKSLSTIFPTIYFIEACLLMGDLYRAVLWCLLVCSFSFVFVRVFVITMHKRCLKIFLIANQVFISALIGVLCEAIIANLSLYFAYVAFVILVISVLVSTLSILYISSSIESAVIGFLACFGIGDKDDE